jgi:D-inositol-3-phosphate glycosyltransferase
MRVAMISYHTCPLATLGGKDTGGMNVYVRDLSRELGRQGIGVDVFTRSQDEHVPHVLHDLGFGNRVVHIPAGPESPVPKDAWADYLPEFIGNILAFAESKDLQYDLIHSHYWLSGMAALALRQAWDIPVVHMMHTLGLMKNRVARSDSERASLQRERSERQLLTEADRIVAATQAELAQFQWLYKVDTRNVVVIPPGVDVSHFYPIPEDEAKEFVGVPENKRMILFVGRIEPLKGVDTLIEAAARLRKKGVLVEGCECLAIIGGDPGESPEKISEEMARLKGLARDLGTDDMVTFLGQRDQDTLQYYYSASDIVVVPSHYESFGLVALEAMACGRTVVASETGGLAFLIHDGENGFHVPAADAGALADKLEMILSDPGLRAKIGENAREYAQGHAWSLITERVVGLYSEVLRAYHPSLA